MVKMIKPEDLKPIDNIIASTYWSDGDILKQDYSTCFHYIADNSFKYTRCSDKTDFNNLDEFFSKVLQAVLSGTKMIISGQYHFGYDRYLFRKGHPLNENIGKHYFMAAIGYKKINGLLEYYSNKVYPNIVVTPYDDGRLPYFKTLVRKAEFGETILNKI